MGRRNQASKGAHALSELRGASWRNAASGLIVGIILGFGALELIRGVIPLIGSDRLIAITGIGGAVIGLTRARMLLWIASAFLVACLLIVGCTPLISILMPPLIRSDPLRKAPA